MENVILIKSFDVNEFENLNDKTIVKDMNTGIIYIGNYEEKLSEIKTDNSNNWAKTFFYGGD